jgi:hypothetical protein
LIILFNSLSAFDCTENFVFLEELIHQTFITGNIFQNSNTRVFRNNRNVLLREELIRFDQGKGFPSGFWVAPTANLMGIWMPQQPIDGHLDVPTTN